MGQLWNQTGILLLGMDANLGACQHNACCPYATFVLFEYSLCVVAITISFSVTM